MLNFDRAQQTPRDQFAGLDLGSAQQGGRMVGIDGDLRTIGPGAAPARALDIGAGTGRDAAALDAVAAAVIDALMG